MIYGYISGIMLQKTFREHPHQPKPWTCYNIMPNTTPPTRSTSYRRGPSNHPHRKHPWPVRVRRQIVEVRVVVAGLVVEEVFLRLLHHLVTNHLHRLPKHSSRRQLQVANKHLVTERSPGRPHHRGMCTLIITHM